MKCRSIRDRGSEPLTALLRLMASGLLKVLPLESEYYTSSKAAQAVVILPTRDLWRKTLIVNKPAGLKRSRIIEKIREV